MKRVLTILLVITFLGVSASALPYISVRISEAFPAQTAPSVAFTAGIDVPLGIAYTTMDVNLTYDLDFSSAPITSTWNVGFVLQYGSDATHMRLGLNGFSTGTWYPYIEFKLSLPFSPFVSTQTYTE